MSTIASEYGNWLSSFDWNFIATFRPDFKLTPSYSDKLMEKLSRDNSINTLFFSLEKDYNPNMIHAHLLLNANPLLTRDSLIKKLGATSKSVTYFQPVIDPLAVSLYCSKHITHSTSHYNFFN
jgi:hypothetical protein